ncbi:hypothetical protein Rs2_05327 [Raphanus sativus]|nr:hypothetical protein Rs2_34043 [Raphanus sativus]KAJ4905106.1 Uncharacterized protein Rs2_19057 [Raphanus sativus]KAJ4910706.1 hypothetical protein Rs2_05327 [Raphanus sativus]
MVVVSPLMPYHKKHGLRREDKGKADEASKRRWRRGRLVTCQSTALASPPLHHHRFIKEQGKRGIGVRHGRLVSGQAWCSGGASRWWSCGGVASSMVVSGDASSGGD